MAASAAGVVRRRARELQLDAAVYLRILLRNAELRTGERRLESRREPDRRFKTVKVSLAMSQRERAGITKRVRPLSFSEHLEQLVLEDADGGDLTILARR